MYVDRENGKIIRAFSLPQYQAQERIDNSDPELIAFINPDTLIQDLIKFTKQEAQKRILALDPEWTEENHIYKQLNGLMRVCAHQQDIIDRSKGNGVTMTPEEEALFRDYRTKEADIIAIREASDLIEQDINNGIITTEDEVVNSTKWP